MIASWASSRPSTDHVSNSSILLYASRALRVSTSSSNGAMTVLPSRRSITSYGFIPLPSMAREELTERIIEVFASLSISFFSMPRQLSIII